MNYISTRGNSQKVSASVAILNGMVPKGGLYLPDEIPHFTLDELKEKRPLFSFLNFAFSSSDM